VNESKSFLKSKTQQGVAIAFLAMVAGQMGYNVEVGDLEGVQFGLIQLVEAGGLLYAAVGRALAKTGLHL